MAGACGVTTPFCKGPYVLTAHMFVPLHFTSVHLPLFAGACAFQVCCSQSLPPFGKYSSVVVCGKYSYFYSQRYLSVTIPLIFQCDSAGWLPLTGLPWFCTSLGSLHLWHNKSFRRQAPSSSTDNEFKVLITDKLHFI